MKKHTNTVIHVVQHLSPGGLETLAINMLKFASSKSNVLIVSLEGNKQDAIKNWSVLKNISHKLVFMGKPAGLSKKTVLSLYRLFKQVKPDVVHTHHIGPLIYGASAARLAGIKNLVHTEHDAWHLNNPKRRLLQSAILALTHPQVVADADVVKMQLDTKLKYHKVAVIKNGVDCERFSPGNQKNARTQLGLLLSDTIIGSAGRLEEVKGHDLLLRAMPFVDSKVKLVIAGDGTKRQTLIQLAKDLHISDRVYFLGLVDDMPNFYRALDVFCLPSRCEGFPLATLEAQACGIPTVAHDVGGTKETLCPDTGLLSQVGDHQALANNINRQLKHNSDRSPRRFVTINNDIRKMVEAYNALSQEKFA
ncbi:glycosyl transferase [Vibrio zhanjiangensis]|uniref:Glycosyl transferase n=1 Tax=Vibrio zhanjiangensis TaxID=1046128 RepID=A0ABQ6F0A1_9VIBR|nr:glycosyltransferase [Vibrio zhanjiangensis]GLT18913.1 glycosyl transferase [Vibrio zhanjiangensis]